MVTLHQKKISSIIALSPVTDLTDMPTLGQTELLPLIYKLVGSTYTSGQPLSPEFALASPVSQVTHIPTLLIYGAKDVVVPTSQTLRLQEKLNENKIINNVISIPAAPHNLNITADSSTRLLIYNALLDWAMKYGK